MEKLYLSRLFPIVILALQLGLSRGEYVVVNNVPTTVGGARFDNEVGIPYTVQLMETINQFIWNILEQPTPADRKFVPLLTLYISYFENAVGYTNGDKINISSLYLAPPGDLKTRFGLILYHEMTHIYQWSGSYTAPGGLTEGVANYVMRKSDLYDPRTSPPPGIGNRWDEGYDVTSLFLEYCDTLRPGFTPLLNKMMRYAWSEQYFVDLLGKPIDQVWNEYKAIYGNVLAMG